MKLPRVRINKKLLILVPTLLIVFCVVLFFFAPSPIGDNEFSEPFSLLPREGPREGEQIGWIQKTCDEIMAEAGGKFFCPHDFYAYYYFSLEEPEKCISQLQEAGLVKACSGRGSPHRMGKNQALRFVQDFEGEVELYPESMRPMMEWLSSYNKHFPDDVEDNEYITEELFVMTGTEYGQNILKSKYLSKYYRHIFEEPQ